ncbi:BTB POZ fold [Fusarium albosuccineum]|uniref:BTB POZ fold n=1 Tax=Fusarium albosuccineum TaxID=1237068 RepID=A0A8H4P9C9_9HYPO|nr:BTB POZ fold [Fusarium albosuccineum]
MATVYPAKTVVMSPERFCDILSTGMFKFVVGAGQQVLHMHSEVVALLSPSLNDLVHGNTREAREKCAYWLDTDTETFACFFQFAYSVEGNYKGKMPSPRMPGSQTPKPGINPFSFPQKVDPATPKASSARATSQAMTWYQTPPPKYQTPPTPVAPVSSRFANSNGHQKPAKKPSDLRPMSRSDFSRLYPMLSWGESHQVRSRDFTCLDALLLHVRVYVLAGRHSIDGLKSAALRKLWTDLMNLKLEEEGVHEIIQLTRFTYAHTTNPPTDIDEMRCLINMYAAHEAKMLWSNSEFQGLTAENGEFNHSFISLVVRQLW